MTLNDFRTFYEREHATTRKVLQAFPADRADFKPHERSNTALQLGAIFVAEEQMVGRALRGEPVLGGAPFPSPADWQAVLDGFDAAHEEVTKAIASAKEAELKPVTFFVAPRTPGEYPPIQFAFFMICDQVHHRGQLSVYLRMVDGKVPSIYGPSADEPWT